MVQRQLQAIALKLATRKNIEQFRNVRIHMIHKGKTHTQTHTHRDRERKIHPNTEGLNTYLIGLLTIENSHYGQRFELMIKGKLREKEDEIKFTTTKRITKLLSSSNSKFPQIWGVGLRNKIE